MNNPGYSGCIVLTDTTEITGLERAVRCIDPLTDCVFTTLTDTNATTNGTVVQSVAADYGTVTKPIYGSFTTIKLTSGSAILYY